MKKKTKIVAIMLSLCMSVSMLAVGVLAASQVSLNVSSSVSFQSTGAYIMATGQVKRGTETSLANLTEEDRPAGDTGTGLSYSYTGYSYTPIGSGSDANAPDGSGSKDLATWNIGSIEFLEREPVVQYEITFKNYGETDVEISITGMPESIPNVEIVGTSLPITVTSGQTEVYTLTLTLTKFNVSIDPAIQVNLNTSMVSKNVATEPVETYTVNYELFDSPNEGISLIAYINDKKLFEFIGPNIVAESGSIVVPANSVLRFEVPYLQDVQENKNVGFLCEIYDENFENLLAELRTLGYSIDSTVNIPYTINCNINIYMSAYIT